MMAVLKASQTDRQMCTYIDSLLGSRREQGRAHKGSPASRLTTYPHMHLDPTALPTS